MKNGLGKRNGVTKEIGIGVWWMKERLMELTLVIVVVDEGVVDVVEMVGKLSGGTVETRRNV